MLSILLADGNGICSLDTDECTPNPCFVEGTNDAEGVNGCIEGIGTYHCVCNPGYEGQNCDVRNRMMKLHMNLHKYL